jgi:hypothetical protein
MSMWTASTGINQDNGYVMSLQIELYLAGQANMATSNTRLL